MRSDPERKVQRNVIVSERDPAVRISLPESMRCVGADRWVLYSNADCEVHVFVAADAHVTVQRLYWVQFEQYIPSRPELRYTYDSPRRTTIDALDFYVDTTVRGEDAETPQDSDLEHVQTLINSAGYNLPPGMMSVRLVHVLDEQMRKELMVIYSEDVASTGVCAADLNPGGIAHVRWPAIEKDLIERAETDILLQPIH